MDPNANLAETRRLAEQIIATYDVTRHVSPHDAARLAELAIALDEWLTHGGFLPTAWSQDRG